MSEVTRISVSKATNRNLTILVGKLGMKKTRFLEKLARVPVSKVKMLLNEGYDDIPTQKTEA